MEKVGIFLSVLIMGSCQDVLVYPEKAGQTLDTENKFERVPLYAPGKCPENELLYPGVQEHDWICDCGPGYVYYPPKDRCFAIYRQGPCPNGLHLVLPHKTFLPKCVANPCKEGYAKYKNRCYEMGKANGPCGPIEAGGGIFDVNTTTLAVECLKGTDALSLFKFPKNCPPGSRRDSNQKCQETW